jgi:hypothetical protein
MSAWFFLLKVRMHGKGGQLPKKSGAVPPFEAMILDMGDAKNTMTDSL